MLCVQQDQQDQAAALADPKKALFVFRITDQSSEAEMLTAFMEAYLLAKGGTAENEHAQKWVVAAVRDWRIDKILDQTIARGCVLQARKVTA